jgi:phage terminase small subunit
MQLDGRREQFCRSYIIHLNASKAAEEAGYSKDRARQTGCELLGVEAVQDRIAELSADRNAKFEVQAVEVVRELHRMLTADVNDAFDEDGNVKPLSDIPVDLRRTIAGFEVFEEHQGKGAEREYIGRTKKIKFWSKEKAAELLGRHLALFKDSLKLEAPAALVDALTAGRARTNSLV